MFANFWNVIDIDIANCNIIILSAHPGFDIAIFRHCEILVDIVTKKVLAACPGSLARYWGG